jgi:hypothetical protein
MALAGAAIIVVAFWARLRAVKRLVGRWRVLEPRGWATALRPARRAWPFNWFVFARRMDFPLRRWTHETPEWAAGDAVAKRALWMVRLTPWIAFAGVGLLVLAMNG